MRQKKQALISKVKTTLNRIADRVSEYEHLIIVGALFVFWFALIYLVDLITKAL